MKQVKLISNNLLAKLFTFNSIIVFFVIAIATFSVKEYSCFLVNDEKITGPDLINSLNSFIVKTIIIVFILAVTLLFFALKKIVMPLKVLTEATKNVQKGQMPSPIRLSVSGELGELVHHFNAMTKSLKTMEVNREEMLKDIAHELRTPLTNINGYLEALQGGVISGNKELFGSLLEESRRITRIVEVLTELHSWEPDGFFLEKPFQPVNVDEILSETLTAFHLPLNEQFEAISIKFTHAVIFGHRDGLKQVFFNLIQNMVDYDVGNNLSISGVTQKNSYLIKFEHQGLFIDPHKKNLIFERFYRLEESRSTRTDGAGLGLAIAKRIIEAHNGQIGLTTNGYNHCFWIKLPVN